MKNCIHCGKVLEDGDDFCVSCGKRQGLRPEIAEIMRKNGLNTEGFTPEEIHLVTLSIILRKMGEIRKHTGLIYGMCIFALICAVLSAIANIAL